jgi:hypothetical protein
MNAQRWIALVILVLVVACVLSSNVWLAAIMPDDDEEEATPTPDIEAELSEEEEEGDEDMFEGVAMLTPTIEATIDPVILELIEESQAILEVGDEPFIIMAGDFVTIDQMHRGEGTVSVYQITDTEFVIRLEDFSVTSGPDLHVYLSHHEEPRTSSEVVQPDYVDLGLLKSNTGAQNYDVPDGVDPDDYGSVVIYSRSFNVIFSTATLETVRGQ